MTPRGMHSFRSGSEGEVTAMPSKKGYSDVYFKKRVDHQAGHTARGALPEPAVCEVCGSIYVDRRWTKPHQNRRSGSHRHYRPARQVLCPACRQIRDNTPCGFVYLKGEFVRKHFEEIERLLLLEADRAGEDNPLARIMSWTGGPDAWAVATTTEHLAQRLGDVLESAYKGSIIYDFSHENKLARVTWTRD